MQKNNFYIFEDTKYTDFYPLTYLRPIYELRCGAFTLRQKIEKHFKIKNLILLTRPELSKLLQEINPNYKVNQFFEGDSVFINGRIIANTHLLNKVSFNVKNNLVYKLNNEVLFVFITKERMKKFLRKWEHKCFPLFEEDDLIDFRVETLDIDFVSYPWDLIVRTGEEIKKDFELYKLKSKAKKYNFKNSSLINQKNIRIGKNTTIHPNVVIDASKGPVIICDNVEILPQSTIIGPAFIGEKTIIKIGAKIYPNCSVGEVCKVGGELDSVIIQSYSNKQHDGYLGHAYIGSWVNFGAGTNNSDLKNNYSPVKAMINGKLINTNLQHFGMIFGDHSKTGINMMFDTGTVVGICCNLYGAGLPPRFIPSFVRGTPNGPLKTNSIDMVLETARIVMQRRNQNLSDEVIKLLTKVFEDTKQQRKEFNII